MLIIMFQFDNYLRLKSMHKKSRNLKQIKAQKTTTTTTTTTTKRTFINTHTHKRAHAQYVMFYFNNGCTFIQYQ